MDFTTVAEFGGAALVIPMILALVKSAWDVPTRYVQLLVVALAAAWGGVLVYGGQITFDAPTFIIEVLMTAAAASGTREHATTLAPGLSNLALLQPKGTAGTPPVAPPPAG